MAYQGNLSQFRTISVPGISLTSTGQTSLLTVPPGSSAMVLDVLVRLTTVTGFISVATARVGKTPLFTEWVAATALTGLNATGQYLSLSTTSVGLVHQLFAAGEVIALDVTVAAVATTATATATVIYVLL